MKKILFPVSVLLTLAIGPLLALDLDPEEREEIEEIGLELNETLLEMNERQAELSEEF